MSARKRCHLQRIRVEADFLHWISSRFKKVCFFISWIEAAQNSFSIQFRWFFFFFLISLIVEGLQFILRVGAFDITDTITNTLGGVIGLTVFKAIEKVFQSSVKAQKSINIIAAVGTVLMILFLLLLKTGNLSIKYQ